MGLRCFVPDVAPLRFFACAAPVLMSRDFVFWVAPHQPRHCEVPFLGLRRSSPDVAPSCLWGEPPHPWCCSILGVAPSLVLRRPWCCAVRGFRAGRRGGACGIQEGAGRSFLRVAVCLSRPHGKSRRLKRRLSHMPGWLPGQCRVRYSISRVAPECSNSSTERILLCALTSSTCRATSRS